MVDTRLRNTFIEGADLDSEDDYGEIALHKAAKYLYLDVVKLLVESGAGNIMSPHR